MIGWWLKHSLLLIGFTVVLYGLGAWLALIRFPLKILLMLVMIEMTPLGAVAGWILLKLVHLFSLALSLLRQNHLKMM